MFHVVLTGNIAAGKSSVASLFRDWGATLFDADATVRELQRPGTALFGAIAAHFGPGVLAPDGTLDRAALRARVLADPAERVLLERLVHPAVQAERQKLLAAIGGPADHIVVSEIPLLFEAADPDGFDAIVLVDAPEALRGERLARERGIAPGEVAALLRMQLPAGPKRARADFVIDNQHSREALRDGAWGVWRKLVSRAREAA